MSMEGSIATANFSLEDLLDFLYICEAGNFVQIKLPKETLREKLAVIWNDAIGKVIDADVLYKAFVNGFSTKDSPCDDSLECPQHNHAPSHSPLEHSKHSLSHSLLEHLNHSSSHSPLEHLNHSPSHSSFENLNHSPSHSPLEHSNHSPSHSPLEHSNHSLSHSTLEHLNHSPLEHSNHSPSHSPLEHSSHSPNHSPLEKQQNHSPQLLHEFHGSLELPPCSSPQVMLPLNIDASPPHLSNSKSIFVSYTHSTPTISVPHPDNTSNQESPASHTHATPTSSSEPCSDQKSPSPPASHTHSTPTISSECHPGDTSNQRSPVSNTQPTPTSSSELPLTISSELPPTISSQPSSGNTQESPSLPASHTHSTPSEPHPGNQQSPIIHTHSTPINSSELHLGNSFNPHSLSVNHTHSTPTSSSDFNFSYGDILTPEVIVQSASLHADGSPLLSSDNANIDNINTSNDSDCIDASGERTKQNSDNLSSSIGMDSALNSNPNLCTDDEVSIEQRKKLVFEGSGSVIEASCKDSTDSSLCDPELHASLELSSVVMVESSASTASPGNGGSLGAQRVESSWSEASSQWEEEERKSYSSSEDDESSDEKLEQLFSQIKIQSERKKATSKVISRKSLSAFIVSDSENVSEDEHVSEDEQDRVQNDENLPPPSLHSPHPHSTPPIYHTPCTPKTGLVFWGSPSNVSCRTISFVRRKPSPLTPTNKPPPSLKPVTTPSAAKNFSHFKDKMIQELFEVFNETVFDGKLPRDTEVVWNKKLRTTAGYCYYLGTESSRCAKIELSFKVVDSYDRIRSTLVHEMCHAATWIVDGIKGGGHGPKWRVWANKVHCAHPGLNPVTRCHSYQIHYKHTYKCVSCDFKIGRHSKSLNLNTYRCPHCLSCLEYMPRLKVDGTPMKEQKLNRYAQFVKEHYSEVKRSSSALSHKQVMEKLKELYSSQKNKYSD